jgi:glycosyltransferase involved in cell wall biosynthesis
MHYTFFLPSAAFGGLEMQMAIRAADATRHGASSLFVGIPGPPEQLARSLDVPVEMIRVKRDYIDLAAAYRLGKTMKRAASKVCVVAESKHLSIAVLTRRLFCPDLAIIFYQQLHAGRKKKDPFHNWVYRNLDGAVVLTQKLKDSLAERTVLPAEKIRVIPYGIDIDAFDPATHDRAETRQRFDLPGDAFIIGLIGRIEEAKGQAVAVEAFAKAGIPDSRLVICGAVQEEGYRDDLRRRIDELQIQESVTFLPFTTEVPALMNSLDLSLLPSRGETFGLVVIEAMAAGIPVIGTDAEGVPEIIEHKRNGLLVPPGDANALAGAIRLLVEDDGLRERIGREARQDTIKRFDRKVQAGKFFDFCDTVYEKRQKRLQGSS